MKHTKQVFYRVSCTDIRFNDYLLLGGGTDINSILYKEKPSQYNQLPDKERDLKNWHMLDRAIDEKQPIFGICRGFQLMAAYFGGRLSQHGSHDSTPVIEFHDGVIRGPVRECHHQSVIDAGEGAEILGISKYDWKDFHTGTEYENNLEIVYWPRYKALAVQFHPEWKHPNDEVNRWLNKFIETEMSVKDVL